MAIHGSTYVDGVGAVKNTVKFKIKILMYSAYHSNLEFMKCFGLFSAPKILPVRIYEKLYLQIKSLVTRNQGLQRLQTKCHALFFLFLLVFCGKTRVVGTVKAYSNFLSV